MPLIQGQFLFLDKFFGKLKRILFLLISLFLLTGRDFQLSAQKLTGTDSLSTVKTEKVHSPKKASIYSAILPGLGQAYNKKYWKIPLIYGTFAALGYYIKWNNGYYQESKTAYIDLTDTIAGTNSYLKLPFIEYYDLNSTSGIANLKKNLTRRQDYYHRNRDLLVILTAAFWGLNVIDASVDAHFFNFDLSDDLSLKWQPSMLQVDNQKIFCLNCTLKF